LEDEYSSDFEESHFSFRNKPSPVRKTAQGGGKQSSSSQRQQQQRGKDVAQPLSISVTSSPSNKLMDPPSPQPQQSAVEMVDEVDQWRRSSESLLTSSERALQPLRASLAESLLSSQVTTFSLTYPSQSRFFITELNRSCFEVK